MKTLAATVLCGLLAVVSLGCAATKPEPNGVNEHRSAAGKVEVLTPFKADPAFLVHFTRENPDQWGTQRNLVTGPGTPDISLRLTHRATGAEIDFMLVPPARPADVAAGIRAKMGGGFTPTSPVTTNASGERSGFTAEGMKNGVRVLSRVEVVRLRAMTDASLLIAAEWPASAPATVRGEIEAMLASITAIPTGPPDARAELAMCLTKKGYRYYGASWCGFCKAQEEMFGPGLSRLRHVDCSPPGAEGARIPECADVKITSYPTWILPDGSKLTGVQSLQSLAEASGCPYAPKK